FSPHIIYHELEEGIDSPALFSLILIACGVFVLAAGTGLWLSYRKAAQSGEKLWSRSAIRLGINFLIPLMAGGSFVLLLFARGFYDLLAPATLIFYGLALLNAGNFTFSDIRSLGILEVVLGVLAGLFPGKGLMFWAFGFGILHIIYGILMYRKYERST